MRLIRSTMLALATLMLVACGGDAPQPATGSGSGSAAVETANVTLALNWFPESQHGGYYAADLKGFYREAKLNVTIQPGGGDGAKTLVKLVATGRVDFGICNADDLIAARAKGAPLVAVMAPLQHSPRCIMVHADSGIDRFEKLGQLKKLAMSESKVFAAHLEEKFQLRKAGVEIQRYRGGLVLFLEEGKTFGQQAYSISEPFTVREKGASPVALMVNSTGWNPYTSMLICNEDTLKSKPDVVRRMVEASARGWKDYVDSPESTNTHIHSKSSRQPLPVLAFGAKEMPALIDGAAGPIGRMDAERWKSLVDRMVELKKIEKGKVDPAACFDGSMVPK